VNQLEDIIREEIARSGPISLARFMELALYAPALGFYRGKRDPFGTRGDFYTAEQLTPFRDLVAAFASKLASSGDCASRFEILELGAGRGELRAALAKWNYTGFDWDGDPLPDKLSGLVIANEFFDALPVRILRRAGSTWEEVVVTIQENQLAFGHRKEIDQELLRYAARYGDHIPQEGLLEVNSSLKYWLDAIASRLYCGYFLIIDYGYSASELARFPSGTLMSYRKHVASGEVLSEPGTRDITAQVNFSELCRLADAAGFQIISECSLVGWALSVFPEIEFGPRWAQADAAWRLQWKQLVFGMGQNFRVLILKR
jgi:SAM-dependent MidA family methyltransferase